MSVQDNQEQIQQERDDQERIRQAKDGKIVEVGCPMPVEIKAGHELDVAVARAIGWTYVIQVGTRDRTTGKEFSAASGCSLLAIREAILKEVNADTGQQYVPRYSTDLNAAFAAAEKASLFGNGASLLLHREGLWRIWDNEAFPIQSCIAEASTPALTICAAILKLKENTEEKEIP